MTPTESLRRSIVFAARDGADDRMLSAMLAAAEQQDRATRTIIYVLAGLLAGSLVANVALVAFVLSGTLTVSGFGVDVGVGAEAPASRP